MQKKELDRMFAQTVAVVRAFNNPHVAHTVGRLVGMGIGRILVVTDAVRDKGATRGWLGPLFDRGVYLIEMAEGFTWSNALNAALSHIRAENFRRRLLERDELEYVLNISVEVKIEEHEVVCMLERMASCSRIGVVGTSFRGLKNGNAVELGTTYAKPRNTCMVIRLAALCAVGHFESWTDGIGGMEDMYFLIMLELCSSYEWVRLDLDVELVVGVNWDQATKEAREAEALRRIVERMYTIVPEAATGTRVRLAGILSRMGVEA